MYIQFFGKRSRTQRLTCAIWVFVAGCGLISGPASAQQTAINSSTPSAQPPATNPPVVVVMQQPKVVDWAGLGWGLGIATNFDARGGRVGTASVINNVVRVEDTSSNASVSFVLEAHYFLRDYFFGFGSKEACTVTTVKGRSALNCTELAHGPFVAVEVGGGSSASPAASGPITGYAMGWMVGMRHPSLLPEIASPTASWNVGLGLRISPAGKVLGDGLVANQPLPPGDSIRYKTEPRLGVMLLSTFSF